MQAQLQLVDPARARMGVGMRLGAAVAVADALGVGGCGMCMCTFVERLLLAREAMASEHRKPIHSQPRRSSRWKMLSATELRSEADVLRSGRAMRQCVWRAACSQPARGPCFFWLLKVTDGPAKYQRGHRIPRPRRDSTVRGWAVLNFGAGSIFEKNVNPHVACKSIVSGVGCGKSQKKKKKKKEKKRKNGLGHAPRKGICTILDHIPSPSLAHDGDDKSRFIQSMMLTGHFL